MPCLLCRADNWMIAGRSVETFSRGLPFMEGELRKKVWEVTMLMNGQVMRVQHHECAVLFRADRRKCAVPDVACNACCDIRCQLDDDCWEVSGVGLASQCPTFMKEVV